VCECKNQYLLTIIRIVVVCLNCLSVLHWPINELLRNQRSWQWRNEKITSVFIRNIIIRGDLFNVRHSLNINIYFFIKIFIFYNIISCYKNNILRKNYIFFIAFMFKFLLFLMRTCISNSSIQRKIWFGVFL